MVGEATEPLAVGDAAGFPARSPGSGNLPTG